jgi:hypothetical protein
LFSFVNVFSSVILRKHVYKTEQYISNITDENTFTKLNSISVILLMRTPLQNGTVYQLCKRILINNIADILFSFVNVFSSVILLIYIYQFCRRVLITNITDILFSFVSVFSSVILLKLNSISVILLIKTLFQNLTVYQ